jgi:hypothetical protein
MQLAPVKQQPQSSGPEDGVPGTTASTGGRRTARSGTIETDEWNEWTRQRKIITLVFYFTLKF